MEKIQPIIRFPEFSSAYKKFSIKDVLDLAVRPLDMKDDEIYSLVTVKRRGGGIQKREQLPGKKIKVKTQFYIKADDYVISKRQIVHGAFGIVPKELNNSIVSNEYNVLTPKNNCNLIYFNYLSGLSQMKRNFFLSSDGVHIEKMLFKTNDWMKRKVVLPSIAEQEKVASFLSSVDSKIEKLERKKELLSEYKRGMMQKIFSQEIGFKNEKGENYLKWQKKRLGEIGCTYGGLSGKTKEDFGEGYPFIQYKQIFDNSKVDIRNFNYVKLAEGESQNKVELGDVFFTVSSETPAEIGMASVLLDDVENLYLNSFCFGFRINKDNVSPYFSRYLFRSPLFRRKVITLAQGSTRYNMSKLELMKLSIDIPCLEEQEKIADFLSSIDKKIELVEREIESNKEFKKGLLQQMFV